MTPRMANTMVPVTRGTGKDDILTFKGSLGSWAAGLLSIGKKHAQCEFMFQASLGLLG